MPPVVTRVNVQRVLWRVDARVQYGDINRTEGRTRAFHSAVQRIRIADIGGQGAILAGKICAAFMQAFGAARDSADAVSCLKKLCHEGSTDARACAGDEIMRHAVLKSLPYGAAPCTLMWAFSTAM